MQNDGVATTLPKMYGKKGRKIRVIDRNQKTILRLGVEHVNAEKKLKDVKHVMKQMEDNPKLYNASGYRTLISEGEYWTEKKNTIETNIIRLENDNKLLKTRI